MTHIDDRYKDVAETHASAMQELIKVREELAAAQAKMNDPKDHPDMLTDFGASILFSIVVALIAIVIAAALTYGRNS